MKIDPFPTQIFQRPAAPVRPSPAPSGPHAGSGDLLQISDEARARIAAMEAGTASLEQASVQSRQQARQAAADKVGMARKYLQLLRRMSSPDDPGAAREAARMAREIRGAAEAYRGSLTKEEAVSLAKDSAAFVTEAGKGLAVAKEMIEQYLQRKKRESTEERDLRDTVESAYAALRSLVQAGVAEGMQQLGKAESHS